MYHIFVNKQPYFVMCENLLKGLIYLPCDLLHVEHADYLTQVVRVNRLNVFSGEKS